MALLYPARAPVLHRPRLACRASSVPWGCDTDSSALDSGIALQQWLSQAGLPIQKVELKNVGAGGRGLVSKRMLYKGDRLLFLPATLAITTESEWACAEAGKVIRAKDLPEWPFLACYLISEASLGKSSPWYPYIAALPRRPGSILLWTALDVETHLSATSIKDRALQCVREVEDTFNDLNKQVFMKNREEFPPEVAINSIYILASLLLNQVFNLKSFKWAFGILFSRLVRLPSLGQKLALIPFGDMLNHDTEVTTFLDFDSGSKSITCTLDRGYESNREVFISYGKRSNGELLVAYGFVPSGKNSEDSVSITLGLDPADEMYEAKLGTLKEHGLSPQQSYPIKLKGWPVQLTAFARLITSPPSQLHRYSELASAATEEQGRRMQPVFTTEEQMKAYELILSACKQAIAASKNYLESKEVPRHGSLPKLASALCESELKILYRNEYILRSELRNLRSGKNSGLLGKVGSMFFRD
ncbi:ribulose-1,5 bisphosphate carboxylase/oxygenase large subunit N-methyltransferase, chloroplastic isoform X1 [Selaginella moellendorffii]|uniref:ribulose-1,5 bisphosphate carboxylase/oxygenase large subunit N-methyltransferase, chloroplastic isoform X1 n=1 Tax=Selaginella moellendorffii TaxID=88036 RepID=UPI000D1C2AF3|nr:ribulose-1,5 bisphosphate carboxylase/oxygenase large subunit N-methyltransferase, chloroplastic isoform X1 [Selaginella moellendorffii]|eukprot:XP_024524397.1 ribulose-1,5 bisphosphate carboxylase/oxygenase large subunit N-methyltransferase, chloroplastic isoform X1 [Selaginella moellendorffii]